MKIYNFVPEPNDARELKKPEAGLGTSKEQIKRKARIRNTALKLKRVKDKEKKTEEETGRIKSK